MVCQSVLEREDPAAAYTHAVNPYPLLPLLFFLNLGVQQFNSRHTRATSPSVTMATAYDAAAG